MVRPVTRRGQFLVLGLALLPLAGCEDEADPAPPPAGTFALTDPDAWQALAPEDDPIERAADVRCVPAGYGAEAFGDERVFSVDTEDCGHLTATQPTLAEIAVGDRVELRVWHFRLSAPEPAVGHVLVRFGDLTAFEETVPIPAESGLETWTWVADRAFAAGTTALFHLRNHGLNSWSLVSLTTERE